VLSDGYIEMSILANPTPGAVGSRTGIKRFGFQVDDVATSVEAAYSAGAQPSSDSHLRPGADAAFVIDPQGQRIDLVSRGVEALAR
jgi:predicted enzyme related to lactoylglutathione lyase